MSVGNWTVGIYCDCRTGLRGVSVRIARRTTWHHREMASRTITALCIYANEVVREHKVRTDCRQSIRTNKFFGNL